MVSVACGVVVMVATNCVLPLPSLPEVCVTGPVRLPLYEPMKVTVPVSDGDFTLVSMVAVKVVGVPNRILPCTEDAIVAVVG